MSKDGKKLAAQRRRGMAVPKGTQPNPPKNGLTAEQEAQMNRVQQVSQKILEALRGMSLAEAQMVLQTCYTMIDNHVANFRATELIGMPDEESIEETVTDDTECAPVAGN
jgi:hypothetical protein